MDRGEGPERHPGRRNVEEAVRRAGPLMLVVALCTAASAVTGVGGRDPTVGRQSPALDTVIANVASSYTCSSRPRFTNPFLRSGQHGGLR